MALKEPQDKGRKPIGTSAMAFAGLGFELAAPLLLGMYGGYRLDQWLETRPWFFLAGSLLGIVVSFVSLFRRALPRKDGRGDNRR